MLTPRRRALGCAAALAVATAAPAPARAAAPSSLKKDGYSRYERESIDAALARTGTTIDPSPAGKIVEGIETIRLDVFEPRDFIPRPLLGFVNWFHVTSRRYVIEREVLIPVGGRYDQGRVDETARNLRGLRQLSLVLCVPVRGSDASHVKLLVITKDIWSLRLNADYLIADGQLQRLLLQPSEENVLGTHHSLSALFALDPSVYTFGGRYIVPRIAGSRIQSTVDVNMLLNRKTGTAEGSYGTLSYGQPLYSTDAKWAWQGQIAWRSEITRRYKGNDVRTFDVTLDDDVKGQPVKSIPYQYRSDILTGAYGVTRSFGARDKLDVTLGVSAARRVFRTVDLDKYKLDPRVIAKFIESAVPVSDTRIGPYVELHARSTRYMTVLDLNTLGLQEDFLLGHDVYLRVSPITTALASSRNFLNVYAAAAYTIPMGSGLARAFAESKLEITPQGTFPNASINAGVRISSPRTPVGRLHFDGRMLYRFANYLNEHETLGGDTRLRGYPVQAFIGQDVLSANAEFRSRAVQILGCQLGGAVFYDVGGAFNKFSDLQSKPPMVSIPPPPTGFGQSAGFGVRILFPQLDRVVMRADLGFPLTRGEVLAGGFQRYIVVTFRQAFPMPALPTGD
jgi:Omp85 superfamily domain